MDAGDAHFDHDAVGNQIKRPGVELITYTAFDLPKSVTLEGQATPITFEYDGLEKRVRKSTPEAETTYFDELYERVIPTDPSAPVEHRYYVYGGERLVAVVTRKDGEPEARLDVHVDHLGSIDVLTNEAGGVEERRSYDAFGARRNPKWGDIGPPPSFTSKSTRGFTGHHVHGAVH
jgi:YD repeat-containing protein